MELHQAAPWPQGYSLEGTIDKYRRVPQSASRSRTDGMGGAGRKRQSGQSSLERTGSIYRIPGARMGCGKSAPGRVSVVGKGLGEELGTCPWSS